MKDSSRRYPLRVLPGVMLASLVGVASAHAQSSTFFVATARTIAGPGDVNVLCDGVQRTVYWTAAAKVCVTVQNDPTSGCAVTVALVDYAGNPIAYPAPPPLLQGESATLCANKVKMINTTPGAGSGTATYHWRVDTY
jgi:hypothetical protein